MNADVHRGTNSKAKDQLASKLLRRSCLTKGVKRFIIFFFQTGDDSGGYKRCGGRQQCIKALDAGWACKIFSCAFNRAPDPWNDVSKTCSYKVLHHNTCMYLSNLTEMYQPSRQRPLDLLPEFICAKFL